MPFAWNATNKYESLHCQESAIAERDTGPKRQGVEGNEEPVQSGTRHAGLAAESGNTGKLFTEHVDYLDFICGKYRDMYVEQ